MIIEIDLAKYPGIKTLIEEQPGNAQALLSSHLTQLSNAVIANHHNIAEKHLKIPYTELMTTISEAFFSYKDITKYHPVPAEAEMLEILEYENNPLTILTAGASAYDLKGNPIPKNEFLGHPQNVKQYLQGLLYAARYIPHKEYAQYLALGQYDLLDAMKYQNVEKLIKIQPALAYQLKNNIPVGKFIEGTGFFDCGEMGENKLSYCPSCKQENLQECDDAYVCLDCKSGFNK